MTIERIETLAGVVDGMNRAFVAPTPYEAGSARVFVRGLLRRQADADGWTETDPDAGIITLEQAPLAGDGSPAAYYLDPTTSFGGSAVEPIEGSLSATGIEGSIAGGSSIAGTLDAPEFFGATSGTDVIGSLRSAVLRGSLHC